MLGQYGGIGTEATQFFVPFMPGVNFIKTKCKQRNVNHIAKYNTRQWDTGQNGVKTETKGYQ